MTVLSPSGARALTWGGGQAQLATRLSARRGGRESPACPFGTAWEAPGAPLLLASLLAAALAGRTELGLGGGGWVCVELGPDEREWGRIEDDREARVYCDDAFASARSTRMMLRGTLEARRAPAPRAAGTRSSTPSPEGRSQRPSCQAPSPLSRVRRGAALSRREAQGERGRRWGARRPLRDPPASRVLPASLSG